MTCIWYSCLPQGEGVGESFGLKTLKTDPPQYLHRVGLRGKLLDSWAFSFKKPEREMGKCASEMTDENVAVLWLVLLELSRAKLGPPNHLSKESGYSHSGHSLNTGARTRALTSTWLVTGEGDEGQGTETCYFQGPALMYILLIMFLCVGLVKGPPPWLNPDISRTLRLKYLSQTPAPFPARCRYPNDNMDTKERKFPCTLENNLLDSVVVQLLVRSPDKQCEHGSMCSVKVGSKLQVEVSLSAAPPPLGLSLALCSLSPSSDPFNYSHTLLIVNGCPADVGVSLTMVPPLLCHKDLLTKTFSFQLAPFYNNSIQFLHCRVQLCYEETSCSVGAGSRTIPVCQETQEHCTHIHAAPLFLRPELQRTVTQPLLVTISAPSRPLVRASTGRNRLPVSQPQELAIPRVGIAGAVGVTVSSFFVGVILTAGLWCIHGRTGDYGLLCFSPPYNVYI
ncbi:transforming growth factor-beta receptor type 3-like protein [Leptodactylus fuscus]